MVKKKRQSDVHDDGSSTDSSEGALQNPTSGVGVCQHVKKSVDPTKLRKVLKASGLVADCMQCSKQGATSPAAEVKESILDDSLSGFEYDTTLWLCLKCGSQLCGRSRNQHALQHYKTPHSDSHALTMNTRTFEIWCYDCDNEVKSNSRKNLLECVEMVKKAAQKPIPIASPTENTPLNNIEGKILSTWESLRPLVETHAVNAANKPIPLPPPPPPPIPGMAKRITDPAMLSAPVVTNRQANTNDLQSIEILPRVRGLTNLGNTCFFNAVMQCLAQTPYLLDVLKELSEPGEEFTLPGGTFKFKDDEDVHLPMIKGTLSSWGGLTAALAQALEELQSSGGVFTPSKLFDKLCIKCPQFRGGDQHDSHELLRHLLESVRSEDLKRYQRVILTNLGYKDQDINSVSEEMRQKCKIYGNQAADRILRPEQVFRGFLVSTLTCQDCYNVSSRHEYFLDMSLPVSVEKPQPPFRRKTSPDNSPNTSSFYLNTPPAGPSKAQLKKEKEKERKAKRAAKHHENKLKQKAILENTTGAANEVAETTAIKMGCARREDGAAFSSSASSSEQSDADIEDNLLDDNTATKTARTAGINSYDSNGNKQLPRTGKSEKRDDSPENMDKDSLDEDENDSGIANSPANTGSNFLPCSETNGGSVGGDAHAVTANNSLLAVGLSEKGATMMRQLSLTDAANAVSAAGIFVNGEMKDEAALAAQLEQLKLSEQKAARMKAKRVRTQSHSDWSTTIAPRYQCEDGECSVQSCLNNFTGVELMTGNNKVGCENCTKRINGSDPKAKTVNTNATKQFLISSPPAVLILHLKRFQLGPRCIFRKLTRVVSFPMVLDIAPFCGSKVKNLPNIDRKQKKLLYALYGIVEHSGGMYGGHYTAYVKVRPKLSRDDKRWKFLPQGSKAELDQDDEQRKKLEELLAKEKARELRMKAANDSDDFSNSSDCSSTTTSSSDTDELPDTPADTGGAYGGDDEARDVQVPMGKWYYVSDSRVQEVNEEAVLRAQAYLLFYERIY
nr:ubiquitin carboxyl-terminal hydrolase 45 isoform X2 [Bactrocera oleae]XP_036227075.1 ubiquitin carboxyl-terminal hydrolase 45 isoform X2 [Bactrocera oleae]XP_036227076.1 ubiquitin carboxyl-terminal hydrolase 45 isoform X2 [Bactrocera oleae]XP_036227077.1 ubiquitin carboxyl-terminal hydrolase 45 isoform X2 [Bactrocera oleae]XP_036227078.1 ubiquitin carboxyl-terminal hydrolase 45 isoform X2 [Bactrocera oleae]